MKLLPSRICKRLRVVVFLGGMGGCVVDVFFLGGDGWVCCGWYILMIFFRCKVSSWGCFLVDASLGSCRPEKELEDERC